MFRILDTGSIMRMIGRIGLIYVRRRGPCVDYVAVGVFGWHVTFSFGVRGDRLRGVLQKLLDVIEL